MTDTTRLGTEGETPVNPYSLLDAVNSASDTGHTAWLIFIGIMAYLMIAVAGVTHKDLLLETPVTLPIMQVNIPQAQFFQFAPVLLVLFHIGLVSQLVLLSRKTLEFDAAVRALEPTNRRTHPLRLELHNLFFVQAISGPHRSAVMGMFLHGMSWLTLVILPVILLLYVQIKFLPYHEVQITWTHRIALALDIGMLMLIGIFLTRAETSFFKAFFRSTRQHPVSFFITVCVLVGVSFFSAFVATVPGETMDRIGRKLLSPASGDEAVASGFALPFLSARSDGSLLGMFHRNLVATDLDLVADKDVITGEPTLNLRGRDLRFAKLDRTDLHQADLTGADLSGASLVGADLRNVRMQCADLTNLILTENRELAFCATALAANFTRAKLSEARMSGMDLRGAKFEDAVLDGAEFSYAQLAGANFSNARLERTDFTGGVSLQGANFLLANLQGADLTGAQLQFADFSSASLHGAGLAYAHLEGAIMRDADLEGADLRLARLEGVEMPGANVVAADLRGAGVWVTDPPSPAGLVLADLSNVSIRPLDGDETAALTSKIDRIDDPQLRTRLKERLATLIGRQTSQAWQTSAQLQTWNAHLGTNRLAVGESYPRELTAHLSQLMCKSRWSSGAVATGIAKRAQSAQFKGSISAIAERLRSVDCPGSKAMPPRVMQQITAAADTVRNN